MEEFCCNMLSELCILINRESENIIGSDGYIICLLMNVRHKGNNQTLKSIWR
jgi:hypothetical protein